MYRKLVEIRVKLKGNIVEHQVEYNELEAKIERKEREIEAAYRSGDLSVYQSNPHAKL